MKRVPRYWSIRVWLRFARRSTRELRSLCISLISVTLVVMRVIELVMRLLMPGSIT